MLVGVEMVVIVLWMIFLAYSYFPIDRMLAFTYYLLMKYHLD